MPYQPHPSGAPTTSGSHATGGRGVAAGKTSDPAAQGATTDEEVGEGSDAWEAAQSILKAINFGSLLQFPNTDATASAATASSSASKATDTAPPFMSSLPPPPVAASVDVNFSSSSSGPERALVPGGATAPAQSTLSNEDRAALQAQLALLAAQLAEIADDTLEEDLQEVGMDVDGGRVIAGTVEERVGGMDVGGEEDDDDDDDMEMVHVPVHGEALRT